MNSRRKTRIIQNRSLHTRVFLYNVHNHDKGLSLSTRTHTTETISRVQTKDNRHYPNSASRRCNKNILHNLFHPYKKSSFCDFNNRRFNLISWPLFQLKKCIQTIFQVTYVQIRRIQTWKVDFFFSMRCTTFCTIHLQALNTAQHSAKKKLFTFEIVLNTKTLFFFSHDKISQFCLEKF